MATIYIIGYYLFCEIVLFRNALCCHTAAGIIANLNSVYGCLNNVYGYLTIDYEYLATFTGI